MVYFQSSGTLIVTLLRVVCVTSLLGRREDQEMPRRWCASCSPRVSDATSEYLPKASTNAPFGFSTRCVLVKCEWRIGVFIQITHDDPNSRHSSISSRRHAEKRLRMHVVVRTFFSARKTWHSTIFSPCKQAFGLEHLMSIKPSRWICGWKALCQRSEFQPAPSFISADEDSPSGFQA